MDFVTIDFETANRHRNSACEIGLTFVENNQIVACKSQRICPPTLDFDFFNVRVHGIHPEDVKDEPKFDKIWSEIGPLLDNKLLIAHNAAFDMSVLRACLDTYDLPYPDVRYSCSYQFSKHIFLNAPAYDLATLCYLNDIQFNHHQAGDDSLATAKLVLQTLQKLDIDDELTFANKIQRPGFIVSRLRGYQPPSTCSSKVTKQLDVPEIYSLKNDPHNLFYGNVVVFTGTLLSMERKIAQMKIRELGGFVGEGVTRDTNFLIVGQQDFRVVGSSGMSGKQKKAMELIEHGAALEILSENEFLRNI
ncbi:MAG: hypothetical protein KBE94_07085 [Paludibacteraceae bacterium]|nr:hypothetical protein [Paludibacteraceae bacterium]